MDILIGLIFCVVCLNVEDCPKGIHDICKQLALISSQECESGTEPLTDLDRSSGELKPEVVLQPKRRPIVLDVET